MLSIIADFFIPIYVYTEQGSLTQVIIITAILATPAVFGRIWGKIADRNRMGALLIGLILLTPLLLIIPLLTFTGQLIIAFCIAVVREIVSLAKEGIETEIVVPSHYGRVGGLLNIIENFGNLIAPVILGIAILGLGDNSMFIGMSIVTLITFIILFNNKTLFKIKQNL